MTADRDLVGGISQKNLMARIDYLRMQMLGAQKELGASIEGGSVQPWPELFDQVAELQQYLTMVMIDLRILERRRLGQTLIDACFPRTAYPSSTYVDDYHSVAVACKNAIIVSVAVIYSTDGEAAVTMRCVLDSQADRQIFLAAGILSSTIVIRFDRCLLIQFNRQPEYAHWGGERIVSWELEDFALNNSNGYAIAQRIRGIYSTALDLNHSGMLITEVLS
jgi:hypothetical protein